MESRGLVSVSSPIFASLGLKGFRSRIGLDGYRSREFENRNEMVQQFFYNSTILYLLLLKVGNNQNRSEKYRKEKKT